MNRKWLMLVALVLAGCVDRGAIDLSVTERPKPLAHAGDGDIASAAANRARAVERETLRLELGRRLRARGQYHLRVAQGLGSPEILAAMDATIARLEAP